MHKSPGVVVPENQVVSVWLELHSIRSRRHRAKLTLLQKRQTLRGKCFHVCFEKKMTPSKHEVFTSGLKEIISEYFLFGESLGTGTLWETEHEHVRMIYFLHWCFFFDKTNRTHVNYYYCIDFNGKLRLTASTVLIQLPKCKCAQLCTSISFQWWKSVKTQKTIESITLKAAVLIQSTVCYPMHRGKGFRSEGISVAQDFEISLTMCWYIDLETAILRLVAHAECSLSLNGWLQLKEGRQCPFCMAEACRI